MCGAPSPETFGVSENARRPLAGDLRSVGKCAATPRRRLSECRKMRGDPSPETFGVSENARRPLAGDFRGVGKCAARGRRTFCTFSGVCFMTLAGIWEQKKPIKVALYCNLHYLCAMRRKIIAFGRYYKDFLSTLGEKEVLKVKYVLSLLETEDRMPVKFIKAIRDGLYELRISYNGNIYRIFFIFDEGQIVVLFNGFQKKTQKTPPSEIEKALQGITNKGGIL